MTNTIRIIARKEAIELWRDGRFRAAAVFVLALLTASLISGMQRYADTRRQHEAAQQETRAQWLAQTPKNPHSAAHYGVYAFKPVLLPSLIDTGLDAYVGVAAFLEPHRQNAFQFRPAQDATAAARFGELTAAMTLQLLIPLLIILLAFGAIAGEREQGTLRQLLSLGIASRTLVLGKAIGIATVLGVLLVPATIIGSATLVLAGSDGAFAADLPRLTTMTLTYGAYFAMMLCGSLAVSARAASQRTALIVLLVWWMGNGVIAPRVAADLGKRLYPSPSAFEFARAVQHDIDEGVDGHSPADQRSEAFKQRVLAQYRVARVEELPVSFAGLALQDSEQYTTQVYDMHFARLWNLFSRQTRVQQLASVAAPFLALRSLSMALAGTDLAHHRGFATAAETYRQKLVGTMNDEMTVHAGKRDYEYVAGADAFQRVPPFSYQAPSLGSVLSQQLAGVMVLLVWLGVNGTGLFFAIRRVNP
jgi:ABC-2 type transport system permease protein